MAVFYQKSKKICQKWGEFCRGILESPKNEEKFSTKNKKIEI